MLLLHEKEKVTLIPFCSFLIITYPGIEPAAVMHAVGHCDRPARGVGTRY